MTLVTALRTCFLALLMAFSCGACLGEAEGVHTFHHSVFAQVCPVWSLQKLDVLSWDWHPLLQRLIIIIQPIIYFHSSLSKKISHSLLKTNFLCISINLYKKRLGCFWSVKSVTQLQNWLQIMTRTSLKHLIILEFLTLLLGQIPSRFKNSYFFNVS